MLGDQHDDHTEEGLADETGAMLEGEPGADVGTGQVADGHDQADLPQQRAVAGEEGNGRQVGGEVDEFPVLSAM